MPPTDAILDALSTTANDWRALAVTWHIVVGGLLLAVLAGWRPSNRLVGLVLTGPFLSVSVLAWVSGNPFNGIVFAIFAAGLVPLAIRSSGKPIERAPSTLFVAGVLLVAFGWMYPHFLRTDSWTAYVYAAPLGLLPCPTLAFVIGITLMFVNLGSKSWSMALATAGFLYGVIGVFQLGVVLDCGLLIGAAILAGAVAWEHTGWRSVRGDQHERTRRLPGDELIAEPIGMLTHAITIGRSPQAVWPWLIQMGAGTRAGWYSYDFLDNGRRASATRIVPELQRIGVGTIFPALPKVTDGFTVLDLCPYDWLILGWTKPDGSPLVTWAFVLEDHDGDSTRLIVRVRGARGYRFHGLPWWLSKAIIRVVHFAMQRKQLVGIARRAESSSATRLNKAPVPALWTH